MLLHAAAHEAEDAKVHEGEAVRQRHPQPQRHGEGQEVARYPDRPDDHAIIPHVPVAQGDGILHAFATPPPALQRHLQDAGALATAAGAGAASQRGGAHAMHELLEWVEEVEENRCPNEVHKGRLQHEVTQAQLVLHSGRERGQLREAHAVWEGFLEALHIDHLLDATNPAEAQQREASYSGPVYLLPLLNVGLRAEVRATRLHRA
eukprot:CAMPEP_0171165698 /NCGR_PEP_ID=MMETSP0790-20130122/6317_1 /TAXON_ID=2925 /ORGANISM="Alexandrium catenella, Strain OF101" /LENGTH=205 /DNA_ID=CAMNT_0011630491 /DNA_START=152 /DNA_END=765 /DNA_ORIENTATION=+